MTYQKYRFTWQGIEIEARYLANNYNVIAHLEIQAINPPRACLPITETGYLSHFHPIGTIEREYGGDVVICVREWLDARAKDPSWKRYVEVSRQGEPRCAFPVASLWAYGAFQVSSLHVQGYIAVLIIFATYITINNYHKC